MLFLANLAGIAGALTLAAGTPAIPAAPPVSIVSCDYSSQQSGLLVPDAPPIDYNDLRITFVDNAPPAATDVHFAVGYGGNSQVVDHAGTFSRGTPVTVDVVPSVNPGYDGSAACSVQAVTFSDGSTWQTI